MGPTAAPVSTALNLGRGHPITPPVPGTSITLPIYNIPTTYQPSCPQHHHPPCAQCPTMLSPLLFPAPPHKRAAALSRFPPLIPPWPRTAVSGKRPGLVFPLHCGKGPGPWGGVGFSGPRWPQGVPSRKCSPAVRPGSHSRPSRAPADPKPGAARATADPKDLTLHSVTAASSKLWDPISYTSGSSFILTRGQRARLGHTRSWVPSKLQHLSSINHKLFLDADHVRN